MQIIQVAKHMCFAHRGMACCRGFTTAIMTAMFAVAVYGQTAPSPAAKLSSLVIFESTTESAPETALGIKESLTLKPVKTIPATLGVHFGATYSISGLPRNEESAIRTAFVHPLMSSPDGGRSQGFSTENKVRARSDGTAVHIWQYLFDSPHELVSGIWKIELWYGNRKMLEHDISVTATDRQPELCETSNLPADYPRSFPFLKGGSSLQIGRLGRFAGAASAYVYSIPDQNLVTRFVECVKRGGWSVDVQTAKEPTPPQTRYRFRTTRGNRTVAGSIYSYGNVSSLLLISE